jgi:hypothetical protein
MSYSTPRMSGKSHYFEIQHTAVIETRSHNTNPSSHPIQRDINIIRKDWNLRSATHCLPHMIAPEGEAKIWPPDLLSELARLATNVPDNYAVARRALLEVWHLRLARFPESNPDLIAQDVETVTKRMVFLKRNGLLKRNNGELKKAASKLTAFPAPPRWNKRKRGNSLEERRGNEALETRRIDKGVKIGFSPQPTPRGRRSQVGESSRTSRALRGMPVVSSRFTSSVFNLRVSPPTPDTNSDVNSETPSNNSKNYVEMGDLPPIPDNLTPQ